MIELLSCSGLQEILYHADRRAESLRPVARNRQTVSNEIRGPMKRNMHSEAKRNGFIVRFDVLYYANSKYRKDIIEEIGEAEGKYIRALRPPLNYQIPKENKWKKYDINPAARTITLEEILNL